MGNTQSVRDLIDSRNKTYGEAWRVTGEVMSEMALSSHAVFDNVLHSTPFFYNWVIIQNKLHRVLADPSNIDTWKDIAGYAQLVVDYIEGEKGSKINATIIKQGVPNETP